MSPVPLAAKPIFVLSFVQLNTVVPSVFVVVNSIASVDSPLHNTWSITESTCAVGLTVIVKVSDGPVLLTPPLSKVGVTVIVAIWVVFEELVAVKPWIVPFPDDAKEIDVLSFVQE